MTPSISPPTRCRRCFRACPSDSDDDVIRIASTPDASMIATIRFVGIRARNGPWDCSGLGCRRGRRGVRGRDGRMGIGRHLEPRREVSGDQRWRWRQRIGSRREPIRPHDLRDDRAERVCRIVGLQLRQHPPVHGDRSARHRTTPEPAGCRSSTGAPPTTIRTVPGEAWDIAAGPVDVFATSSNPRAAEQTVTIWNAKDGQQQVQLVGHTGTIQGLAFSRDGATVATGGDDGIVRLWDASTGSQLLTLMGQFPGADGLRVVQFGRHAARLCRG